VRPLSRGRERRPKPLPPTVRFRLARWSAEELILFDDERRESWILYPPRSLYARRRGIVGRALVVEQRPWAPEKVPFEHVVTVTDGCVRHGMECAARQAIEAAVQTGFDPFA